MADYVSPDPEVVIDLNWIDGKNYTEINGTLIFKAIPWQARANLITFDFSLVSDLKDTDAIILQTSVDKYSGWEEVAIVNKNTNQVLDINANSTLFFNGPKYYRIVFPTIQRVTTVHNVYGDIDKIGAEISRRHRIMLAAGQHGNRAYVFIRHKDGIRCPECWDDITQQKVKAVCNRCLNTGWIVGFYDPIEIYVSYSQNQVSMDLTSDGITNSGNKIGAWTSNYPLLSVGDVIIDCKTVQPYSVENIQPTLHKRVVTKQSLLLTAFQGDDPKMELIKRLASNLLPVIGRI